MKVIGFGDNVVDKYVHINTIYPGGNCVNFAVNAKKLGVDSAYMGVFGNDESAKHIIETLTEIGIDISECVQYPGENGCSEVGLVDGDRVLLGWNDGGVANEKPMVLEKRELDYLGEFQLIHSSCYSKTEQELAKLRSLNSLVGFDFSEEEMFRQEDYLKRVCPNIDFALFSGGCSSVDKIKELMMKIVSYGTRYVLATRGTQGSIFFDGETFYEGTAKIVKPIDTMGCGDSFLTAFLIHLLQHGWSKTERPNEETIREGLKRAADFSAENCFNEGAFGYGKKYTAV